MTPRASDIVFERGDGLGEAGHEQVVFCRDSASGLQAIIGIHDTRLGPALGGTRFYPYSSESAALTDVLRLSQGMTYKAAAAGLDLGGGKAVIIGDPNLEKTPELLRSYGRFVESLAGRYYTAADVGTTAEDLDLVSESTRFVVGTNAGSGDSGFSTALGVFTALTAGVEFRWGVDALAGLTVGVEGLGKVGGHLVGLLRDAGATVIVSDVSDAAIAEVRESHPDVSVSHTVLDANVDVYAPCALGATLSHASIPRIQAAMICGAANNQLADGSVSSAIHAHGITWIPDYVANAGGLIQVGGEIWNRTPDQVHSGVLGIARTVRDLLLRSVEQEILPIDAANKIVEARLAGERAGLVESK